jgi:hypothetical protein
MRKPKARVTVPPFSNDLFPHREFPAWLALARVFDVIGASLRRQAVRSNLKRLHVPLAAAAERIMIVASGGLAPPRWHRRICAARRQLERAKQSLDDCVGTDALTPTEADLIRDGIDDAIVLLGDAVDTAQIPSEVRAQLPELPPLRVLH